MAKGSNGFILLEKMKQGVPDFITIWACIFLWCCPVAVFFDEVNQYFYGLAFR